MMNEVVVPDCDATSLKVEEGHSNGQFRPVFQSVCHVRVPWPIFLG